MCQIRAYTGVSRTFVEAVCVTVPATVYPITNLGFRHLLPSSAHSTCRTSKAYDIARVSIPGICLEVSFGVKVVFFFSEHTLGGSRHRVESAFAEGTHETSCSLSVGASRTELTRGHARRTLEATRGAFSTATSILACLISTSCT